MEEFSSPNSYLSVSHNPLHQNVYSDLMPVSTGDCYTSMYLPTAPPSEAHSPCVKMEMGRLTTMREHKILGKRKINYSRELSDFDDESGADDKSVRTNDDKKQNHSEIEKRRRDKMNTYITELATMIPMCHANPRKLDKLTVLRMAVQHLRSIRGAVHSYTEGHYKPTFLSDEELKHLILEAAEGFLFVVGCDRGRILFVSESVSETLHYSQGDLLGQSWFDILHPKDVAKVKEQLSPSDLNPRERLIDSKTMLPVKTDVPVGATRLGPGSRRSFLCRMKCRPSSVQVKEDPDTTTGCHRPRKKNAGADRRYCVVQCTGYMKSWASAKMGLEEGDAEGDSEGCNLSCLVAVARVQGHPAPVPALKPIKTRPIQFVSRHALDGTFLFVDQRVSSVLGLLPQELIGSSMYEYFHQEDIVHLADTHRYALQNLQVGTTQTYRFRMKDGGFIRLQSDWRPFKNPWTKDVEYIIAKNTVIASDVLAADSSAVRPDRSGHSSGSYQQFLSQGSGIGGIQRIVTSHAEASLIGQQIAKETIQRRVESPSSASTPSPSGIDDSSLPIPNIESPMSTTTLDDGQRNAALQRLHVNGLSKDEWTTYTSAIRNNVPLSSSATDASGSSDQDTLEIMGGVLPNSPQTAATEGNDEAAMAVIMSLLEADAGLGGPVDFSGLPWPLP